MSTRTFADIDDHQVVALANGLLKLSWGDYAHDYHYFECEQAIEEFLEAVKQGATLLFFEPSPAGKWVVVGACTDEEFEADNADDPDLCGRVRAIHPGLLGQVNHLLVKRVR